MPKLLWVVLLLCSSIVHSAPKSELWDRWVGFSVDSDVKVDHQVLDEFLSKYTTEDSDGNRLIKYASVTGEEKDDLSDYIKRLAATNPGLLNRNEQFAFWVNLYNALTIQLILDNYPIESIAKLGGFFSFGPWDKELVTIMGNELTLNDIEHRILRPIWKDNRIHYVVNCASLGCPNIGRKAFSAENRDGQLDAAAKEFINSSKGFRVSGDGLILSKIYQWYSDDFGDLDSLMEHFSRYRDNLPLYTKQELARLKVSFEYNWLLNESK